MKTLEEFLDEKYKEDKSLWSANPIDPKVKKFYKMVTIEFAKYHVEEALKAAAEQAILSINGIVEKSNGSRYFVDSGNHYSETEIDIHKDSILNAYILDNIK